MTAARKAVLGLAPYLTFGPLFMVNFGADHTFSNYREPIHWLATGITIVGALSLSFALAKLMRTVARQADEIEQLRAALKNLPSGQP
jgi:hypothetical protein